MIRKWLVVGTILLFIGVSVAPSINHSVVTASQDDDLVEVTTQAYGIKGYGDTTVKLTREQYQDLEQYLVGFRARLNQTSTREEAITIFKEAVVELDKYGLLPKGMNVEQGQQLFRTMYRMQNIMNIVKKSINDDVNAFCLFAALIYRASEWSICMIIAGLLMSLLPSHLIILYLLLFYSMWKPLRFMNVILNFGHIVYFFSIGLKGIQKGTQDFDIIGFTGLKIIMPWEHSFYLGFTLWLSNWPVDSNKNSVS
jgi:hypothetical protein